MKTIEERAMRYGWKRMEAYHNLDDASDYIMWERFRSAYSDGAAEQKKIDIEKACEWLEAYIACGVSPEGTYSFVARFRKAMEE